MTELTTNNESAETALYTIGTVSELTGVNAITLRAWERRYGLFEPVRKASGHRLYTQAHIDLITHAVGLLDRGMRIGQIKAQLEAENTASRDGASVEGIWARYLDQMVSAVIQFNEAGLENVYSEALSLYSINDVTDKLLTPLLTELGRRWESSEGSIAEEHFFGFYLRNKLGARFHHRVKSQNGPKLLMACLPGDRHETGLLLFALAANLAGYCVIPLGSDMPLEEFPPAARKTGCQAIVLSGLLRPDSEILEKKIPALTASIDVPVFLGGRASVETYEQLKRADVIALGTNVTTALARLQDLVPVA